MASQSPDGKNSVESMSNDPTQNSSEKPPIGSGSKRKRVKSPSDKVFVIIESLLEFTRSCLERSVMTETYLLRVVHSL